MLLKLVRCSYFSSPLFWMLKKRLSNVIAFIMEMSLIIKSKVQKMIWKMKFWTKILIWKVVWNLLGKKEQMPLNKINLKRKKMKKMNIFRFMIMLVCRFNTNIVYRISYRVMMILNPIFWALSVRILTTKNLISSLDVWQITLNKIARISSKTKTILIIKKKNVVKVHVKFSKIKLKRQMLEWTMTIW